MRSFTIFSLVFFVLFINDISFSQSVRYGVGGGFTFILGPDSFTEDIDTSGNNFGFSSNYHLGAKAKLAVSNTPIALSVYLYYTSLSGNKENTIVGSTVVDFETSTSYWTMGIGGEYHFRPAPVSPYLSLDIQFNNLNDLEFKRISNNNTETFTSEGNTRMGLAFGGGLDLNIMQNLSIDTALKFNFINLFGQDDNEDGLNTFGITVNLLYSPSFK